MIPNGLSLVRGVAAEQKNDTLDLANGSDPGWIDPAGKRKGRAS
jgi:hypothetical protein